MTAVKKPKFKLAGDQGLVVEFGNKIDPQINAKVRSLFQKIKQQGYPGVIETVPTYRSLMIYYNPMEVELEDLKREVEHLTREGGQEALNSQPRLVKIPVLYGGEMGPDLEWICEKNDLSKDELVDIHTSKDYLVYTIGFAPGFPYLGRMSRNLFCPRLEEPRTKVPEGSVAIAESQTVVYAIETPGGWRIIGRTPLKLFDLNRERPTLLQPGDHVRFILTSEDEYGIIEEAVKKGEYKAEIHPLSEVKNGL